MCDSSKSMSLGIIAVIQHINRSTFQKLPLMFCNTFPNIFPNGRKCNPMWNFQKSLLPCKGFLGSKVEILTKFIDQINGLIIYLMYGEMHI